MKYIDKYSKEELLDQLNDARKALMMICENVYKYTGELISIEQLIDSVDSILSKNQAIYFDHKYIQKDFVDNIQDDVSSNFDLEDDLEEMKIIDL